MVNMRAFAISCKLVKNYVSFPVEERSEGMIAEDIPLCIVYEDDAVLVINKEAKMSTIPSREHPAGSVANALLSHYDKQHLASTVHIVTRLDRDTSGLMLIAKIVSYIIFYRNSINKSCEKNV